MENIIVIGIGAVVIGLLVAKMIFGSNDAKPEELEWDKNRKAPKHVSNPTAKPKPTRAKKETMDRFAQARDEHRADSRAQRIRNSAKPDDAPPPPPRHGEGSTHKSLRQHMLMVYGIHFAVYLLCNLVGGAPIIIAAIAMFFVTQKMNDNVNTIYFSPTERERFGAFVASTKEGKSYLLKVALPVYLVTLAVTAVIGVMMFALVGVAWWIG